MFALGPLTACLHLDLKLHTAEFVNGQDQDLAIKHLGLKVELEVETHHHQEKRNDDKCVDQVEREKFDNGRDRILALGEDSKENSYVEEEEKDSHQKHHFLGHE